MEDDAEPVKQEKSSYVKMEPGGPKEGWDASVDVPFLSPPPPGGPFYSGYEPQSGFGASAEREMVQAFTGHDAAQEFVGATGVQEYGSAEGAGDHNYAVVGQEGGYVGENSAGFGGASLGRDAVQRDEHGGYAHSADNV